MFNKEEEKTVISMDMGGKIEPVELPKEEEIEEAVEETKSTVIPQLMQIETKKDDVPKIVDSIKVVEVPKPVPTIGEVKPTPVPTITEVKPPVVKEKKEEVKVDVKPTPVIMPLEPPKPVVPVAPPKPTPTIGEVKPTPTPMITEVKKPEVPVNNDLDKTIAVPKVEVKEKINKEEKTEDKVIEKVETKEEVKEEPKVEYGPSVISEPLAKEDTNKEKKKNPHFLECPPNCKPIRPFGYLMLNILYMIPVIGLIFILAHSASYKNLNRRNYARSYLVAIFLIILIIFALIYFLKIDFIGIIENIIGYKIDLQHFKFIKFK